MPTDLLDRTLDVEEPQRTADALANGNSSASATRTPASGWVCPRCGTSHEDASRLAVHMVQCSRLRTRWTLLRSQGPSCPSDSAAQSAGPGPGVLENVRYRYIRVMQRDPLNAATQTVTFIPLVEDKPFACPSCPRYFATVGGLRKHFRTHSTEREHACPHPGCGHLFALPSQLRRHLWVHTESRPHGCDLCPLGFFTPAALRLHRISHTAERPHQCPECGKVFRTANYLSTHSRMHTGERPFKCPIEGCDKGFARRCNLRAHLVSHTRERPHACLGEAQGCPLRFQFRKQMENHARECQLAQELQGQKFKASDIITFFSLEDRLMAEQALPCGRADYEDPDEPGKRITSDAPEYIDIETFGAMRLSN